MLHTIQGDISHEISIKDTFIWFSDTKSCWWGTNPCTWNFGSNWPHLCKNAYFQSIFSRSTSAV